MNKEEKLKLNASHYANNYLNGWVKEGEWMKENKNAYSIIVPWDDGEKIAYAPMSDGSLDIWVGTDGKMKKMKTILPEDADLRGMRPPIYNEDTKCAKFVIPKVGEDSQYSRSDLHRMLCDAYAAGHNRTIDAMVEKASRLVVNCVEDMLARRMEVWHKEDKKKTLENVRKALEGDEEIEHIEDDDELKEKLTKCLSEWFYGIRTWGLLNGESNEDFCKRKAKDAIKDLINVSKL